MRLFLLFLALAAAAMGLMAPFFQKVFVDRLLAVPAQVPGLSWSGGMAEVHPLFLIFLASLSLIFHQGLSLVAGFLGVREGLILQRKFSQDLYTKMLSLRSESMAGRSVGEVVAIYATDIPGATALIDQAMVMALAIVFPILFAPLAVKWVCGIPLWATLLVMGMVIGLTVVLSIRQARFFHTYKLLAATRTGLVNEWIQNIRMLRILNWVESFEKKIFEHRRVETRNRVAMVTNGQMMGAFGSSISFVINLTGVASLVFLSGREVTPGELFALLWILGAFLARPFRQVPWLLTVTFDALSSMRRLENFLSIPSISDDLGDRQVASQASCEGQGAPEPMDSAESMVGRSIKIRGLNFSIGERQLLRDVSFDIRAGEFIAVVGEVGSGKSLLVHSLVGETSAEFKEFEVGGMDVRMLPISQRRNYFALVSQEGFVMSGTLRENIVFQYEESDVRDEEVLVALQKAQFYPEAERVRDGVRTELGERGVNLSGGQKQRVSLARASYFRRPVILLDDCLSAVDVDTERRLIDSLLKGAWAGHTRILVTHRLSVLKQVDRVFLMSGGRIIDIGRFEELMVRSQPMRDFVASVTETREPPAPKAEGGDRIEWADETSNDRRKEASDGDKEKLL